MTGRRGTGEAYLETRNGKPVLVKGNGRIHYLTWWERFCLFFGMADAEALDDHYRN